MKTSEQIVNNGNTRAMCGICLKLRIDARTMFSVPLELILTKLISAEIILLYYLLQILKISLGSVKVTSLLIEVYREVRSLKLTVTIIWFLLKIYFCWKRSSQRNCLLFSTNLGERFMFILRTYFRFSWLAFSFNIIGKQVVSLLLRKSDVLKTLIF